MKESGGLKIYSYVKPHCKLFRKEEFGTVGQFQSAVEEWFGIPVDDQKFVIDGRVMEEKWLTSPFNELNIKENNHLIALTKTPHIIKRKRIAPKTIDSTLENSIVVAQGKKQQVIVAQKALEGCDSNSVKLLNCLKDVAVESLITHFIKALSLPRAELLLLNEQKLLFILQKATQSTSILKKMLLDNIDIVKSALIDQEKLQQVKQIPSTVPTDAVDYLIKLKYSRERAVQALEVCRNDLYAALTFLSGGRPQQLIQFNAKRESIRSEFISIAQWLARESKKPLVHYLRHKPEDLPIFMNSWKHTCPELFELTIRWQPYLPTLFQHIGKRVFLSD